MGENAQEGWHNSRVPKSRLALVGKRRGSWDFRPKEQHVQRHRDVIGHGGYRRQFAVARTEGPPGDEVYACGGIACA